jgi:hypothetical protein
MKIYVPFADKYLHLIPIFAQFFNKYWGHSQEVHCLCSHIPKIQVPNNFKFVDIGTKWKDEPWSNALIDYFNSINDKYFIFTLDDHLLVRPVDFEGLSIMEKAVATGAADKAMIHAHLNDKYGEPWEFDGHNCIKIRKSAPYRTTIHPAIWSRKLFLRWLKPNQTIWQFESDQTESKNDNSVLVSWPAKNKDGECLEQRGDNIFNVFNVYRSGEFQHYAIEKGVVLKEDLHMLESII